MTTIFPKSISEVQYINRTSNIYIGRPISVLDVRYLYRTSGWLNNWRASEDSETLSGVYKFELMRYVYVIVIPWILGVYQNKTPCPESAARGLGRFVWIYPVVTVV